MEKYLIIDATRDKYSPEELAGRTMTVAEFIEELDLYDQDAHVVFSFDNGYTYGRVTTEKLEEDIR